MTRRMVLAAMVAGGAVLPLAAGAQGSLNVYCSAQVEWCQAVANAFQRETGIRVAMTQKGSGEVLAQIRAEAQNPRGDVWFGGTGDPHLQAAEDNLSAEYRSPNMEQLHPWAQKQAADSRFRTVGIYAGALGFGFNTELIARRNIPAPACWSDLLKPEYRNEIQMANLRVHEVAAPEHQHLYAQRHRADQGGGARRDGGLDQLRARRGDRAGRRLPGRQRDPVRGHGLRDRLDVDHQGRPQS